MILKENKKEIESSIIIWCKNELNNLEKTIESIIASKVKTCYEIIIINDGSIDGDYSFIEYKCDNIKLIYSNNIGIAASRNLGVKDSHGKYLFFLDAHVRVKDYWMDELIETVQGDDIGVSIPIIKNIKNEDRGYGGSWNSKLQFIWLEKPKTITKEVLLVSNCAFLIKKEVFQEVGGFDNNLQVYGVEDQEISIKLWTFGYRILLDCRVEVEHLFEINKLFKVSYIDIIYNYMCLVYLHFDYDNLVGALNVLKEYPGFSQAVSKMMLNENLKVQRKEYLKNRKYNESYIFKKFNISF